MVRVRGGKREKEEKRKGTNSQGGVGRKELRKGGREKRREDGREGGRVNIHSTGGQKGGFGNAHLRTYQVKGRDRGVPPMVLLSVLVSASQSAPALAAVVSSSFFASSSWCVSLSHAQAQFPSCACGGVDMSVRTAEEGTACSEEGRANSNQGGGFREEHAAILPSIQINDHFIAKCGCFCK